MEGNAADKHANHKIQGRAPRRGWDEETTAHILNIEATVPSSRTSLPGSLQVSKLLMIGVSSAKSWYC